MRRFLMVVSLALLLVPGALAVGWNDLPVRNVYDPTTRHNEPIRDYTFWELDALLDNPRFRQWNDMDRVCDTMYLLYGRAGHSCPTYQYPQYAPPSVRAYVPPSGVLVYPSVPRRVVYVGPPPWAMPWPHW